MSENTKIAWATHSFSPWIGCSKVHAGCTNCYAEAMAGRLGVTWGPNGTRRRTAESTWKKVERWNRAEQPFLSWSNHERPRVFPSLCDPFEDWGGVIQGTAISTFNDVRRDFFALIDRCQNLDFLLLTKRPENIRRTWECKYGNEQCSDDRCEYRRRDNCWLLYSASNQQTLDSGLPHLLACRDLAPVLGLSLEPLIGQVDLTSAFNVMGNVGPVGPRCCGDEISWVICGGESGPHARPMQIEWLESIAEQCTAANVSLYVKQDSGRKAGQQGRIPDSLWARKEFPHVSK